ncbi:MAG: hypothetical protein ACK5FV_03450, partial [Bacteroidota bacterium]
MKYRFCHIIVFVLVVSVQIRAQEGRADSLKILLASAPRDTHRVSLLADYAWEIVDDNPEEALLLTREAVQLAQQLGYRKGEAAAWNTMGLAEEVRDSMERA